MDTVASIFSATTNILKIIAYITTPIMVSLIAWLAIKLSKLIKSKREKETDLPSDSKTGPTSSSGGAMQARWEEVLKHIGSTVEGEWKFGIIEADKLVDDTLRSAGFPGETMGERLMSIEKGQIQNLDGLWEAHKTRNRLVHDANYFLRYAEAKRAVQQYQDTLKELGVLDLS